ncbi:MAG: hypothetical protein GX340_01180 [Clostridiales bacterium]|nr:hypothetical protein [Clostridiales bacterium]
MFYKGRKKGYVILIFVLATLMVGGYFLGTLIGNQVLGYNVGKQDEEPGYQVIRTVNRDNLDKPDYQVPTIEVITRDTKLVFEKVYIGCGHKRVEERRARENEIGLSIQSIALRFPEWSIADYTTERIVFTKEVNDFCPGHFLLKDRDGVVVIYMPSEEGDEYKGVEETQISTDSLPPDLQSEIRKGLILDTLEDVEHFMENLES